MIVCKHQYYDYKLRQYKFKVNNFIRNTLFNGSFNCYFQLFRKNLFHRKKYKSYPQIINPKC